MKSRVEIRNNVYPKVGGAMVVPTVVINPMKLIVVRNTFSRAIFLSITIVLLVFEIIILTLN